jgi:hypothetical protein
MRVVKDENDCLMLQNDLNQINKWSQKWEMEFNINKCKVLEFGSSKKRITHTYKLGNVNLCKERQEKDLGVIVQDNLTPEKHINKITGAAYNQLMTIRTAFVHMDEDMMKKIFVTMIRPKLEYAVVIWSPHKKKDIRKIERIQRVATKMIPGLAEQTYEERLEKLGLLSLEKRRERGDLIAVYKGITGMERFDREDMFVRDTRSTRGHSKKLMKSRCVKDVKKYSFPYHCIDTWNALDDETVHAKTVSKFKEILDKKRYGDGTPRV